MNICFNLDRLAGSDRRIAEYLARLARYREASAEFAAEMEGTGRADMSATDAAWTLLQAAEEEAVHDMMLPLADAAQRIGYSHSHLRRLTREHGPEGDRQIRAERRHGNSWYVYPPDVTLLIETDESSRGPYRE